MSINYVKWLNEKGLSEGNDTFEVIMDQYEWRKEAMKKLTASASKTPYLGWRDPAIWRVSPHPDRMVRATGEVYRKAKYHEVSSKVNKAKSFRKGKFVPLFSSPRYRSKSAFQKFLLKLKSVVKPAAKVIR